jgi:hypothetical protein
MRVASQLMSLILDCLPQSQHFVRMIAHPAGRLSAHPAGRVSAQPEPLKKDAAMQAFEPEPEQIILEEG